MITIKQAKARGFAVDTTIYPHVAYKGPRFAPTEVEECMTEREAELLEQVHAIDRELETVRTGKRPEYKAPAEWGLTAQQNDLFVHLLGKPECRKDDIINSIWPDDDTFTNNRLAQVVHQLRGKLAEHGVKIRTIWGDGFALENRAGIKAMLRAGGTALQ